MAQHDYILENQPGAAFRADLNAALQAIVSQNSGATEPSPSYPFQPWADTTAGRLKQRNAGNNSWVDVLDLATGRPVGAVAQTGATGAVLLPEGDDSERPDEEDIPDGALAMRGSTQDPADYKIEFWDRVAEAWKVVADRTWVNNAINTLQTTIQNWVSARASAVILYPGGTAAAPANIEINQTIEVANPYLGKSVSCRAEVFYLGEWCTTGWMFSAVGYGVSAAQRGGKIYVQAGGGLAARRQYGGGSINLTASDLGTPVPIRIVVSLDGGVDA